MSDNRSSVIRKLCYSLMGSSLLLTMACGGTEDGRPVGDSTKRTAQSLNDCEVQSALAQQVLLPNGQFDAESVGSWGSTTDKSSNMKCPRDSTKDCCVPGVSCESPEPPMIPLFSGTTGTDVPPAHFTPPCEGAAPKGRALHVRAADFKIWGGQIYLSFTPPRNASEFDGISFWARLGQGGTQPVGQTLFIVVEDKFTKENQDKFELEKDPETKEVVMEETAPGLLAPKFARDSMGQLIPVYPAYSTQTQAKNCYDVNVDAMKCDRFGSGVGLEPEWRFVKLPFDAMRQRGYGVVSPAGRPLKEELLGVGIYFDVGNWDFWIDHFAFYTDKKPNP